MEPENTAPLPEPTLGEILADVKVGPPQEGDNPKVAEARMLTARLIDLMDDTNMSPAKEHISTAAVNSTLAALALVEKSLTFKF
jgi:hypothetical protein